MGAVRWHSLPESFVRSVQQVEDDDALSVTPIYRFACQQDDTEISIRAENTN